MAIRGAPHKPMTLAVNNAKKGDSPDKPPERVKRGPLVPPKALTEEQKLIWDGYIEPAWWLAQCDVLLAYMFVNLYAEYLEKPSDMIASRIAEMRRTMGELHLTSSEQARMGIEPEAVDPTDAFFSD